MKRTVISSLLTIAVICSIFVNVFATENPNPYIIKRGPEVTITK
jgi:hypothetical protein